MSKLISAELLDETRHKWTSLPFKYKQEILELSFIRQFVSARLYFQPNTKQRDVYKQLERKLKNILNISRLHIKYYHQAEGQDVQFLQSLTDQKVFNKLTFGSDIAEQDHGLSEYFVNTKIFEKAQDGEINILIGPKGSGKTAILKKLESSQRIGYSITITPEVFATSMLAQFVSDNKGIWDEQEAFVSTWIFTIFTEVYKRINDNPRGIPKKVLTKIRMFLRSNSDYQDLDLFTRFIGYLKRIEAVKFGSKEITLKTKELQKLYALEEIYAVVPDLRSGLKENILILIDELDQGWDNSDHSNKFVASLLQAATKIQNIGLRVKVIVFVRSEIFDLIKSQLDQLDKLRSGIGVISWKQNQLASLIIKRAAYSVGYNIEHVPPELVARIFGESIQGLTGFEYIISRTTMRPRELLQFVRHSHGIAVESKEKTISKNAILEAEEEYSQWKIEHLCSEYKYIYPELQELLLSFRGYGPVLSPADISELIKTHKDGYEGTDIPEWLIKSGKEIVQILYSIDFIGVSRPGELSNKHGLLNSYEFSYERSAINAKNALSYLLHPIFWKALELSEI